MEVLINIETCLWLFLFSFKLFLILFVNVNIFFLGEFFKWFSWFCTRKFFLGLNAKFMIFKPVATVSTTSFLNLWIFPKMLKQLGGSHAANFGYFSHIWTSQLLICNIGLYVIYKFTIYAFLITVNWVIFCFEFCFGLLLNLIFSIFIWLIRFYVFTSFDLVKPVLLPNFVFFLKFLPYQAEFSDIKSITLTFCFSRCLHLCDHPFEIINQGSFRVSWMLPVFKKFASKDSTLLFPHYLCDITIFRVQI